MVAAEVRGAGSSFRPRACAQRANSTSGSVHNRLPRQLALPGLPRKKRM